MTEEKILVNKREFEIMQDVVMNYVQQQSKILATFTKGFDELRKRVEALEARE